MYVTSIIRDSLHPASFLSVVSVVVVFLYKLKATLAIFVKIIKVPMLIMRPQSCLQGKRTKMNAVMIH